MGIHIINDGKAIKYGHKPAIKEKEIEDNIEKHPQILDKDIFIIGRQVRTAKNGIIDLMGMDKVGNVIIIEIKKSLTDRDVVSQILDYCVWAEELQYEELNKIAKEQNKSEIANLYQKFSNKFEDMPNPLNQNQRLYIVAEKIDKKTEDICRYLAIRGINIKCIELNFYENNDQKLVDTKIIVDPDETNDEIDRTEKITWEDKLAVANPENKETVLNLIKKIKDTFQCKGMPHSRWYRLYANSDNKKSDFFAVVMCGKEKSRIAIKINSETFSITNEQINRVKRWFFGKEDEIRIPITEKNFDLIIECAKHARNYTVNKNKTTNTV